MPPVESTLTRATREAMNLFDAMPSMSKIPRDLLISIVKTVVVAAAPVIEADFVRYIGVEREIQQSSQLRWTPDDVKEPFAS